MKWCNLFHSLALCLVTLVGAAPAHSADSISHPGAEVHTFNVTIPDTADIIKARGYDHSTEFQDWATVEVWTGGDKRKPVNWGNLRGRELSDRIFNLLDSSCPWNPEQRVCRNHKWQDFETKTLVQGKPNTYPFTTATRRASIKTETASYATPGIRTVLAQIVVDTLAAYTKHDKGYNCYEHSGEVYCNVPLQVRVNLPHRGMGKSDDPAPGMFCAAMPNSWHIVTHSADDDEQLSPFGELRPCKTRLEVDAVMDKYKNDILKEFPKRKDSWRRDARVIINGDDVCSNEP